MYIICNIVWWKSPGSHILGLPCKAFLVFLTLLLFKVKVSHFAGHTHRILLQWIREISIVSEMYTISLHGANFDRNPGVGEVMVVSRAAYRIDWRLWFILGLLIQCTIGKKWLFINYEYICTLSNWILNMIIFFFKFLWLLLLVIQTVHSLLFILFRSDKKNITVYKSDAYL